VNRPAGLCVRWERCEKQHVQCLVPVRVSALVALRQAFKYHLRRSYLMGLETADRPSSFLETMKYHVWPRVLSQCFRAKISWRNWTRPYQQIFILQVKLKVV